MSLRERGYLGEVANDVKSKQVIFSHDVEEKWVSIVVQCLVVQEELRKKTQVLCIGLKEGEIKVSQTHTKQDLILSSVNLKKRHAVLPIYFIPRGMVQGTL